MCVGDAEGCGEKRALRNMDLSLTLMDPVSRMRDTRDDGGLF